jgi:hypothetical protein
VSTIDLNGKTYFKLSELDTIVLNGETYISPPFPGTSFLIDNDGDEWIPADEAGKWKCEKFPHLSSHTREDIEASWGISKDHG